MGSSFEPGNTKNTRENTLLAFERSTRGAWALAEFHVQGTGAVAGIAGDSLGADGSCGR